MNDLNRDTINRVGKTVPNAVNQSNKVYITHIPTFTLYDSVSWLYQYVCNF